jgi:predicted nucleic acid-binding protein
MVFVDTSAWFARHVSADPNHQCVRECFDKKPRELLITTDYCVDETLTLLAARGRRRLAVEVGRALFEAKVARIHFLTPDQVRRAWILFQTRASAGWSFTDCTSKVVMDDLNIKTAVALDAHFRQFGILVHRNRQGRRMPPTTPKKFRFVHSNLRDLRGLRFKGRLFLQGACMFGRSG